MSNKKISQFEMLLTLSGLEQAALSYAGSNYRVTLNAIAALATKETVGLGNVDNTSDIAKPISTAVQAALSGKANISHSHTLAMAEVIGLLTALSEKSNMGHTHVQSEVAGLVQSLSEKSNVGHTHLVTMAEVVGLIAALAGKADLEHFHEQYAYAEHAHANYSEVSHTHPDYAAVSHVHTQYAPLESPNFTGVPTVPLANLESNNTEIANTAFVKAVISGLATLIHTHQITDVQGLTQALSDRSLIGHTHVMADITDYVPTGFTNDSCEVVHLEDITRDLIPADAGKLLRFESAGSKQLNIISEYAFTEGKLFHVANRSTTGDLTLTFITGDITLNPPKGGLLVLEPGDTVSLHYVGFNTFDVYGSTKSVLGY